MIKNKKFEKAINCQEQNIPPIWFMRQAGRYHKHYQNLRKSYTFEDLCKNPELAMLTAMGPIEEFDFDNNFWNEEIKILGYNPPKFTDNSKIDSALKLIEQSERPVILAGHGIIISRAYDELLELAEKAQIPVVTTLLGISSFPENHVLSLSFPGMHGVAWASLALDQADLVIAIGSRFDDRIPAVSYTHLTLPTNREV